MTSQLQGEMKGEISVETVPCMEVEWKFPKDILLLSRDTVYSIHSPSFEFQDMTWYLRLTFFALSSRDLFGTIHIHAVNKYPVCSKLRIFYHIWIKTTSGNKYGEFYNDCQYNLHERVLNCWGQIIFLNGWELPKNITTTSLDENGVIRFFWYFWVDSVVSSPSISRADFLCFQSKTITIKNIGEISSEKAGTMCVEWKVRHIPLLSPNTNYRIRSSSFQFKGEMWYLQATIHDRNIRDCGKYASININLVREERASPILYVEYTTGLKLFDGQKFTSPYEEYVFDGTTDDCSVLTNLVSTVDKKLIQAPNGEVTFFCYLRWESPRSSNAGSKKISEGNHAKKKTVPTALPPSTLNWTPGKPNFSSGNVAQENPVPTVSSPVALNLTPEKPKFSSGASKLFEDFKNLFISGEHSDLKIKVKDTEFKVHKNILCARSSVFHSMLSHDMVEKNSGIIDITDCEPEVFKIFLLYLYNGCVENLSTDTVFDLCKAADKYDNEELKLKCKDFMLANLSVDTVCDVIDHALQYNEEELLKTATVFFVKNFKAIILTVNWQTFMKKNTVATNELLIKASNYYVLKEE